MDGLRTERIEAGVDALAAAIYAAGTALVLSWLGASSAYAAAGGSIALGWCIYGLRSVEPEAAAVALTSFTVRDFETAELLLGEDDRLHAPGAGGEPLILDDVLAVLGPDSRVVRLFDRDAMPTPRQLQQRIDRHLGEAGPESASPDASQALHQALAELRRSLR